MFDPGFSILAKMMLRIQNFVYLLKIFLKRCKKTKFIKEYKKIDYRLFVFSENRKLRFFMAPNKVDWSAFFFIGQVFHGIGAQENLFSIKTSFSIASKISMNNLLIRLL